MKTLVFLVMTCMGYVYHPDATCSSDEIAVYDPYYVDINEQYGFYTLYKYSSLPLNCEYKIYGDDTLYRKQLFDAIDVDKDGLVLITREMYWQIKNQEKITVIT